MALSMAQHIAGKSLMELQCSGSIVVVVILLTEHVLILLIIATTELWFAVGEGTEGLHTMPPTASA